MTSKNKSITNLLESLLTRMLQAEEDILEQLKLVSQNSYSGALKTIFDDHALETSHQIQRLKDCLNYMESNVISEEGILEKGKKTLKSIARTTFHTKSDAIDGIIKEGERVFKDYAGTNLHDYVLASGGQSLEMGEIAAYKTLISLAKECDLKEIKDLLEVSLKEELNAYDLLKNFSDQEAKKAKKTA